MKFAFFHKVSHAWDGRTPDFESLDGPQTALIGLSRALAALGHEVAIFGTPPQPGLIDGVLYQPASVLPSFLAKSPVDVLVSTVNTDLLKLGIKAPLHLYWAHDDYQSFVEGQAADLHAGLAEMLACRASKVVALSDGHADLLRQCFQLPADHVWSSPIGMAPAQLKGGRQDWPQIAGEWVEAIAGWQRAEPTTLAKRPFEPRFPSPQVSIIIPTYNRAANLRHCLESLCQQLGPPFEVLVCDDGSTDDTRALVLGFTDRLNLRYLWQPHLGFRAGAARNMGLKQARGAYTILLDSDLVVPPTFVAAHMAALMAEAGVGVNSYVYRTSGPVDVTDKGYGDLHAALQEVLIPDHRDRFHLFDRPDAVEEAYFLDSNAVSFRTKDLIALQGFDEAFVGWGHEDTDLGYRMGARGFKLRLLKEGAVAYHLHHPIVANKETEQQANWERMRQKWRLENVYKPLGHLPIECLARRSDSPEPISVRLDLKASQGLRFLAPYVGLTVTDGILREIRWLDSGDH
jgi:glycosyltransferase involved in cell wall biosynthesis